VNQFTHLTFDEFLKEVNIGGTRIPNLRRNPEGGLYEAPADDAAPVATVDWTTKGAVTSVKNQGSCGSCWSFSAAGALEGAKWIKYKTTESLSEQQLVACDTAGNDKGCNGGWMDDAFKWIKGNGGLCSEAAYPYASSSGTSPSCKKGCTPVSGTAVSGWTDVTPKSVSALASAVTNVPVAIAIQANQPAFQSYKSGVLTGTCGQRLDHGVLLVGYGTDNGLDYWKVKNSWGTSWGEQGYIRIEKSSKDLCGVLDAPSFVTVV
jgi:cathepsin L